MSDSTQTRRTALKLLGATAATTGLTSTVAAQDNESENETENETDAEMDAESDGETDQLPIILGGRSDYWYGIAPDEIEGEENPTLQLEEGEEYEIVWVNVDGEEHELILESEDGEELEASDSAETAGEAVSMTFEPEGDAAEYYCEYHPEDMVGDVEFGDGFDLSPDAEGEDDEETEDTDTDGNETDTDGNETDDNESDTVDVDLNESDDGNES